MQPRISKLDEDLLQENELEEWQRRTCTAKWRSKQNIEDPEETKDIKC